MADLKKYLDTTALGTLVDQIKSEDAKVLAAAKKYTDDASYDVLGSAATAKSEAIADADAKFSVVNENIDKKADKTALEAEVTRATNKEAEIVASVESVDVKSTKNAEDIAAINNGSTGILAQAKAYASEEDAKVQSNVDAVAEDVVELTEYIGTIPEGATATDIVGYVQEKTAGIATDAALGELQAALDEVEADVTEIMGDYLKASDKEELQGNINAEAERASGVESGLNTRIKSIEEDYLKGTDKTELQGKINEKAAQTALDAEIERATGVEESLQSQINTIMNNPDAEGAINSINEFTAYVEEHGTIADGMRTDINKNKDDIAAEVKRAGEAESALSGRLDTLEAIDHNAYIAADTALKNELNGEIAKKADSSALTSAIETLENADAAMAERLDDIETVLGTGEGSVADQISTAKNEAIAAAAEDSTSKANAAQAAAIAKAVELDGAMNARVEAMEAIDHEHSNKALLDSYTQTESNLADAVSKKHTHANATVLNGITADKVSAWDTSEQNAKTYADGLNTAMSTKVDGVDTRVKTLEETIVDKAEADDLDAAVERIAKNETDITSLNTAINSFVAITPDEVTALFA